MVDIAVLIECRLLELSAHPEIMAKLTDGSLGDPRVQLVMAFGQVYLLDNEDYRPYLTSAYVVTVSADPLRLHLLRDLPEDFEP